MNHKYILTIKYKKSDTVGDWYEFWIKDLTNNSNTCAGALRFPSLSNQSKKGITDGGGTWTELYYRKVQNSPLPEWSISILEISAISKDGATIYPKTIHLKNANNFFHIDQIFHTENNHLDFIIGGSAKKVSMRRISWCLSRNLIEMASLPHVRNPYENRAVFLKRKT